MPRNFAPERTDTPEKAVDTRALLQLAIPWVHLQIGLIVSATGLQGAHVKGLSKSIHLLASSLQLHSVRDCLCLQRSEKHGSSVVGFHGGHDALIPEPVPLTPR